MRHRFLHTLASSFLADHQQRRHFQEAGETPDAHAVLQHPDPPQAPAVRPGHVHMSRQQWGERQAEASECYRLR